MLTQCCFDTCTLQTNNELDATAATFTIINHVNGSDVGHLPYLLTHVQQLITYWALWLITISHSNMVGFILRSMFEVV